MLNSSLQQKIQNLSALRYNKALELCNDDRISDAIAVLKESLEFDKHNIMARNLIGLCYYRLGRVADALIEWTVSFNMKATDNIAADYIAELESAREASAMYSAIEKYNQALSYANQGNTDMAILNLKKAVEQNKFLTEALNLLALCYMERGRENEAFKLTERVLVIDRTNTVALRYNQLLRPEKRLFFKPRIKNSHTRAGGGGNIRYFVWGVVLSAVIVGGMGIPAVIKSFNSRYNRLQVDYDVLQNEKDTEIADRIATIDRLTAENADLKSKLHTADTQELQQRVRLLTDIENYYNEGSIEEAADKLLTISTQGFSQEVLTRYNAISNKVLPAAAKEYFSEGRRSKNRGDYVSAKNSFNNAIKCTKEGDEVRYSSIYQLGLIADAEGDNATAVNYFRQVAAKHPVESVRNEAKGYIENASDNE